MIKLLVEDKKGNVNSYNNVYSVNIKKIKGKKYLEIEYNSLEENEHLLLNDIKLCVLIDINTMHEYFRYEK